MCGGGRGGVSLPRLSTPQVLSPSPLGSGYRGTHHKLPAPSTTAHTMGHTQYKEVSLGKSPAALSDFLSGSRGCMGTDPAQQAPLPSVCVLMSTRRNNFSNKLKGLTLPQCQVNIQKGLGFSAPTSSLNRNKVWSHRCGLVCLGSSISYKTYRAEKGGRAASS